MSLYLDSSSLLKLLLVEPESSRVSLLVAAEDRVVVSLLARLEALVQVQGRVAYTVEPSIDFTWAPCRGWACTAS